MYNIINELSMFFEELAKSLDKVLNKIGESLANLIMDKNNER